MRFVLPAGTLGAHLAGSVEHAHVAQGTIEVRVAGERIPVEAADSVVFPTDQPHGYTNVGAGEAHV